MSLPLPVDAELDWYSASIENCVNSSALEAVRDALWAGMGSYIELWAKESFEGLRRDVLGDEDRRLGIAKRLAELGL